MKILMITGSYPPESCGVGDYTKKLVVALSKKSINIEVLANIDWSLPNFNKICSEIDKFAPEIIHIQFPSMGFGYGILPQLLSLKYRVIVTVHEASLFHPLRQLWLLPFSIKSNLIFTNHYERAYFKKIFPWFNKKTAIAPIGSNITEAIQSPLIKADKKINDEILYFGLIRPKKGIEQVLELAALINQNNLKYKIKIIGHVIDRYRDYFEKLKNDAKNLPVIWVTNLSETEVSAELEQHLIAYLPYPDGASERRASLLAALKSEMLIFSTHGEQSPDELQKTLNYVTSPDDLVKILLSSDSEQLIADLSVKTESIRTYLKKFDWNAIASAHAEFYDIVLNQ